MDKRTIYTNNLLQTSGWVILLILFFFFIQTTGAYNFCYVEEWNTFFYDAHYIRNILAYPGGLAQLIANFLIQFFVYPIVGVLITALLLTLISFFTTRILYKLTHSNTLLFLSFFPVVSLLFLHFNVNYLYTGTIALLLMLLCICLQSYFRKFRSRFIYSLLSTFFLFIAAGPVALLYSCLLFIIELFQNPKKAFWFVLLPLFVFLFGKTAMWFGLFGNLKHAILPDGYFTLRLHPGFIIYLPWVLFLIVFSIACIYKIRPFKKTWTKGLFVALQFVAVSYFIFAGTTKYMDTNNEFFKELNHYARHNAWDKIVNKCDKTPMTNLLYQNYLNVALAEKGVLADNLFSYPCVDIRSIYVTGNKTPYISALLSDVYFSMGHIALSQRYAFEANESVGNYSPRMIQRLVQTNLAYGYYGTAQKYLRLLNKTLFYKDWTIQHQHFLWDDKAIEQDSVLGAKRRCLFPDNRFSGYKGLDDDLKQIIIQNPSHKTTIQYLGSLYLLSKDMEGFRLTLENFYNTPALPSVLPVSFQEGVLVLAEEDSNMLNNYQIQENTIQRYKAYKQHTLKERHTLWHFLNLKTKIK
ncbi:DUF6057 family protein [Massilibacteroides sp.]|uniref:DUF6057 family protein n=1 Tax=Massilibacteroides sp. TaxID=2034766 RepID=UPI002604D8BA|nr:DUF6057 family protein [Massilibacteroides sp.]MDD4514277.1 DUF6057 family protein [Massilibacteroides sp.]